MLCCGHFTLILAKHIEQFYGILERHLHELALELELHGDLSWTLRSLGLERDTVDGTECTIMLTN